MHAPIKDYFALLRILMACRDDRLCFPWFPYGIYIIYEVLTFTTSFKQWIINILEKQKSLVYLYGFL